MKNLRSAFLLCAFAFLFCIPAKAQTDSSFTVYAFVKLKDGSSVSGELISSGNYTLIIKDFSLGKLTIKQTQVVSKTEILKDKAYCFTMTTGQKYCGQVVASDSLISLNTASLGVIKINPKNIKEVQNAADVKIVDGEEWFPNPHPNRYFFVPSAIPMAKGDGYFQNVMLDLNTINYGFTDHISGGIGFAIPWGFMATIKTGYQVAPKIYAGGGIMGAGTFFDLGRGLAAVYGLVTYGTFDHNVTFSSGYGFSSTRNYYGSGSSSTRVQPTHSPMFTLSGMTRLTNRLSLVTENWAFPVHRQTYHSSYSYPYYGYYTDSYEYQAALSLGIRTMWPKNSFDLALVCLPGVGGFSNDFGTFLPYIDYVFKF
jgi:hypothetical protein